MYRKVSMLRGRLRSMAGLLSLCCAGFMAGAGADDGARDTTSGGGQAPVPSRETKQRMEERREGCRRCFEEYARDIAARTDSLKAKLRDVERQRRAAWQAACDSDKVLLDLETRLATARRDSLAGDTIVALKQRLREQRRSLASSHGVKSMVEAGGKLRAQIEKEIRNVIGADEKCLKCYLLRHAEQ